MQNLSLHFPQGQTSDRALGAGVHRIVREAGGKIGVGDAIPGTLLVQVCLDRRGLWLQVPQGMRGIHVNGRPVLRTAMLRPGDALYADGVEVLVRGQATTQSSHAAPPNRDEPDPRIVLRGVGGRHHGRAFPIGAGCVIGASREADIRIEATHIGPVHARLRPHGNGVVLRHHDGAVTSVVNGIPVSEALLGPGDQVVFDSQSRFVVEIPWVRPDADDSRADKTRVAAVESSAQDMHASMKRWPWLLLAAVVLAGLLSLLLLFGAK